MTMRTLPFVFVSALLLAGAPAFAQDAAQPAQEETAPADAAPADGAPAADDQAGEAPAPSMSADAIKTAIDAAAADPAKTKAYCDMAAKMEEVGDDQAKAEAAGDQIDGYFKVLGAEFEAAWTAGQDAPADSDQAKAFDESMTKLDDKCGKQ